MARQIVTDHDGNLTGWFDPDKGTEYPEGERWTGQSNVSLATGTEWDREALWRTAKDRWVLHSWARRDEAEESWHYVDEGQARDWLLRNEYDAQAIDEALGVRLAEEVSLGGRPEIGPQVKIRFPVQVLAAVDELADAAGVTRSAWIRDCVTRGVEAR